MSVEVARVAARVVEAADRPSACGIRWLRLNPLQDAAATEAAVQEASREVRALGFVAIQAGGDVSADAARDMVHRHVVLFVSTSRDRARTVDWIRRLSMASPRAHLVAEFRSPGEGRRAIGAVSRAREPAAVARERACLAEGDEPLVRATSHEGPPQRRAAEQWLVEAVERARRCGDEDRHADVVCRLVRHLADEGALLRARAVAIEHTRAATVWEPRARLAAEAARVLVSIGDLLRAEGVLAGISAEAAHRDVDVPPAARRASGELYFWQGRFEEAQGEFDASSGTDTATIAWRALGAWARGDSAGMRRLIGPAGDGLTFASVAALGHAMAGDAGRTLACVATGPAPAGAASGLGRLLDRAVRAEALLSIGDRTRARDLLGSPAARTGEPWDARLEDVLLERLRAACDAAGPWPPQVCPFIGRTGAKGLARFGLGRPTMSVLHAVPALLQLVQESDDDLVTLRRGCAWMRRHTGADAVGVVTVDEARVVAADGLQAADLADGDIAGAVSAGGVRTVACVSSAVVVSPVRYGGVTIGSVVARGRPEAVETLRDAAAALAALLGATLRARLDAVAAASSRVAIAPEILGRSPSVAAVREAIARAAGTNFAVLIEGESGTGKELVARALHRLSARRHRRLAAVNCAALTDELIEAELFGHARGAFTGAVGARTGLFEDAHGGTLFLDEVGELSARGQAKLLRVLQEREIRRLGENNARPIDVRVIAATNLPLADAVSNGRFREDLLFRLAVVRIRVPALRDRIEDVPLLAQAFWKPVMADTGKRAILGPDALAELCRHRWPGNIRELQNVVSALAVGAPPRGAVRARHVVSVLASVAPPAGPGSSLELALRGFERQVVSAALARHGGRRTTAARELGLTRQGLTKAIRRLGLTSDDDTEGAA